MKKYYSIFIIVVTAFFVAGGWIFAASQGSNPFDLVWGAIAALRADVDNLASRAGLGLYDANGQRLGLLVSRGAVEGAGGAHVPGYHVYEPSNNVFLVVEEYVGSYDTSLEVRGNGGGIRSSAIRFKNIDCAGEAYARLPRVGPQEVVKMSVPGNPRYFRGTNDAGAVRTPRSASAGESCFNFSSPVEEKDFLLEEIKMPFSEPLAWPLEAR